MVWESTAERKLKAQEEVKLFKENNQCKKTEKAQERSPP